MITSAGINTPPGLGLDRWSDGNLYDDDNGAIAEIGLSIPLAASPLIEAGDVLVSEGGPSRKLVEALEGPGRRRSALEMAAGSGGGLGPLEVAAGGDGGGGSEKSLNLSVGGETLDSST